MVVPINYFLYTGRGGNYHDNRRGSNEYYGGGRGDGGHEYGGKTERMLVFSIAWFPRQSLIPFYL